MVGYLCEIANVSRSGYYNYFASKSQHYRFQQNKEDELIRDNILKAYNFKRRKKGARQIKMTLEGNFGIVYNLKRIRRVKERN